MGNKCCKCQSSNYSSVNGTVRSFSSCSSSVVNRLRESDAALTYETFTQNPPRSLGMRPVIHPNYCKDHRSVSSSDMSSQEICAPVFLRRLNDLQVRVGGRTRLLIELEDTANVQVRWYKNNQVAQCERYQCIHEGGFYCLDIVPVTLEDEGLWVCTAQNFVGKSSTAGSLTLTVPKAFKKPIFLEDLKAILTQRGIVSLECKVIGVPTPKLRWFKDGREVKAGDIFALTANSDDDCLGIYTCEASNVMGISTSTSRIHVTHTKLGGELDSDSLVPYGPPPKFIKGLDNASGKVGGVLVLKCQIDVPPWPRSVGWYNNNGIVEEGPLYHLIADGLGMYGVEIKSLRADHNSMWKCIASSATGAKAVTTCTLSVSYPKNYRVPRFLESLRAIMTDEGMVSFECKVIGYPTPQLSWFKDGKQLQPGDVYELTGSKSLGSYCCLAQNCMGEASSYAELTVEDIQNQLNECEKLQLTSNTQPPRFIVGLKSAEANINESLVFTVKVTTEPEPSISWFRENEHLIESDHYRMSCDPNGTFVLKIEPIEVVDQAEWKCVAINRYGQTVTSSYLKLNIPKNFKAPKFLEELRIAFSNEGSVNLECKVIGVPQPKLKWFKDGQQLNPGDMHKIISGQGGTCCLGTYTCQAHNCMGTVSSSATLLTIEDKSTVKSCFTDEYLSVENPLVRNESLSTILEERTSQMEKSVTIEEPADVTFSFDGKEVTVSLYETPDLTHDEALQIIEMYADELSEHITEDNVVDLPSLRIVKESSISGHVLMEALVIDVPVGFCRQQTVSVTDMDAFSITEDTTFPHNDKRDSLADNSLEFFSEHLSEQNNKSSNSKKDEFFSASEVTSHNSPETQKQLSEEDGYAEFRTPKLFMSDSDDQILTQLNLGKDQKNSRRVMEALGRSESKNTEEEVTESLSGVENEQPPIPDNYYMAEILAQSDEDGLYSAVLNKIRGKDAATVELSMEEDDLLKIISRPNVEEFLKYMSIILEGTTVKMSTHESSNFTSRPTELEHAIRALHSLAWRFVDETEKAQVADLDKKTIENVSNLMTAINASLLALEQFDDPFGVSDSILNEIQSSTSFDLETINNLNRTAEQILDNLSEQIKNFTSIVNRQVSQVTEQRIIAILRNTISTSLVYIKTLQQSSVKLKIIEPHTLASLFSMIQPLEIIMNEIVSIEETPQDKNTTDTKLKQMLIPQISSIAFLLENLCAGFRNENLDEDEDLKKICERIDDATVQFLSLASQGAKSNNLAECFIMFTKPINDLCCHLKRLGRSTENIVSSDYGSDDKLLMDFETLFDELMVDIDTLVNNVNTVRDFENNVNPLGSLLEPLQHIKIGLFQVNQVLLANHTGSNMSYEVISCFENLSQQLNQLNNCIINQSIVEESDKEIPFETSIKMMQSILFDDAIDDLGVNGILFGSVMKPLLQLQNLIVSKMAAVESDLSFSDHTELTVDTINLTESNLNEYPPDYIPKDLLLQLNENSPNLSTTVELIDEFQEVLKNIQIQDLNKEVVGFPAENVTCETTNKISKCPNGTLEKDNALIKEPPETDSSINSNALTESNKCDGKSIVIEDLNDENKKPLNKGKLELLADLPVNINTNEIIEPNKEEKNDVVQNIEIGQPSTFTQNVSVEPIIAKYSTENTENNNNTTISQEIKLEENLEEMCYDVEDSNSIVNNLLGKTLNNDTSNADSTNLLHIELASDMSTDIITSEDLKENVLGSTINVDLQEETNRIEEVDELSVFDKNQLEYNLQNVNDKAVQIEEMETNKTAICIQKQIIHLGEQNYILLPETELQYIASDTCRIDNNNATAKVVEEQCELSDVVFEKINPFSDIVEVLGVKKGLNQTVAIINENVVETIEPLLELNTISDESILNTQELRGKACESTVDVKLPSEQTKLENSELDKSRQLVQSVEKTTNVQENVCSLEYEAENLINSSHSVFSIESQKEIQSEDHITSNTQALLDKEQAMKSKITNETVEKVILPDTDEKSQQFEKNVLENSEIINRTEKNIEGNTNTEDILLSSETDVELRGNLLENTSDNIDSSLNLKQIKETELILSLESVVPFIDNIKAPNESCIESTTDEHKLSVITPKDECANIIYEQKASDMSEMKNITTGKSDAELSDFSQNIEYDNKEKLSISNCTKENEIEPNFCEETQDNRDSKGVINSELTKEGNLKNKWVLSNTENMSVGNDSDTIKDSAKIGISENAVLYHEHFSDIKHSNTLTVIDKTEIVNSEKEETPLLIGLATDGNNSEKLKISIHNTESTTVDGNNDKFEVVKSDIVHKEHIDESVKIIENEPNQIKSQTSIINDETIIPDNSELTEEYLLDTKPLKGEDTDKLAVTAEIVEVLSSDDLNSDSNDKIVLNEVTVKAEVEYSVTEDDTDNDLPESPKNKDSAVIIEEVTLDSITEENELNIENELTEIKADNAKENHVKPPNEVVENFENLTLENVENLETDEMVCDSSMKNESVQLLPSGSLVMNNVVKVFDQVSEIVEAQCENVENATLSTVENIALVNEEINVNENVRSLPASEVNYEVSQKKLVDDLKSPIKSDPDVLIERTAEFSENKEIEPEVSDHSEICYSALNNSSEDDQSDKFCSFDNDTSEQTFLMATDELTTLANVETITSDITQSVGVPDVCYELAEEKRTDFQTNAADSQQITIVENISEPEENPSNETEKQIYSKVINSQETNDLVFQNEIVVDKDETTNYNCKQQSNIVFEENPALIGNEVVLLETLEPLEVVDDKTDFNKQEGKCVEILKKSLLVNILNPFVESRIKYVEEIDSRIQANVMNEHYDTSVETIENEENKRNNLCISHDSVPIENIVNEEVKESQSKNEEADEIVPIVKEIIEEDNKNPLTVNSELVTIIGDTQNDSSTPVTIENKDIAIEQKAEEIENNESKAQTLLQDQNIVRQVDEDVKNTEFNKLNDIILNTNAKTSVITGNDEDECVFENEKYDITQTTTAIAVNCESNEGIAGKVTKQSLVIYSMPNEQMDDVKCEYASEVPLNGSSIIVDVKSLKINSQLHQVESLAAIKNECVVLENAQTLEQNRMNSIEKLVDHANVGQELNSSTIIENAVILYENAEESKLSDDSQQALANAILSIADSEMNLLHESTNIDAARKVQQQNHKNLQADKNPEVNNKLIYATNLDEPDNDKTVEQKSEMETENQPLSDQSQINEIFEKSHEPQNDNTQSSNSIKLIQINVASDDTNNRNNNNISKICVEKNETSVDYTIDKEENQFTNDAIKGQYESNLAKIEKDISGKSVTNAHEIKKEENLMKDEDLENNTTETELQFHQKNSVGTLTENNLEDKIKEWPDKLADIHKMNEINEEIKHNLDTKLKKLGDEDEKRGGVEEKLENQRKMSNDNVQNKKKKSSIKLKKSQKEESSKSFENVIESKVVVNEDETKLPEDPVKTKKEKQDIRKSSDSSNSETDASDNINLGTTEENMPDRTTKDKNEFEKQVVSSTETKEPKIDNLINKADEKKEIKEQDNNKPELSVQDQENNFVENKNVNDNQLISETELIKKDESSKENLEKQENDSTASTDNNITKTKPNKEVEKSDIDRIENDKIKQNITKNEPKLESTKPEPNDQTVKTCKIEEAQDKPKSENILPSTEIIDDNLELSSQNDSLKSNNITSKSEELLTNSNQEKSDVQPSEFKENYHSKTKANNSVKNKNITKTTNDDIKRVKIRKNSSSKVELQKSPPPEKNKKPSNKIDEDSTTINYLKQEEINKNKFNISTINQENQSDLQKGKIPKLGKGNALPRDKTIEEDTNRTFDNKNLEINDLSKSTEVENKESLIKPDEKYVSGTSNEVEIAEPQIKTDDRCTVEVKSGVGTIKDKKEKGRKKLLISELTGDQINRQIPDDYCSVQITADEISPEKVVTGIQEDLCDTNTVRDTVISVRNNTDLSGLKKSKSLKTQKEKITYNCFDIDHDEGSNCSGNKYLGDRNESLAYEKYPNFCEVSHKTKNNITCDKDESKQYQPDKLHDYEHYSRDLRDQSAGTKSVSDRVRITGKERFVFSVDTDKSSKIDRTPFMMSVQPDYKERFSHEPNRHTSSSYLSVSDTYRYCTTPTKYRSLTPELSTDRYHRSPSPYCASEPPTYYTNGYKSLSSEPYSKRYYPLSTYRCPSETTIRYRSEDESLYTRFGMRRRIGSDSSLHQFGRRDRSYHTTWRTLDTSPVSSTRWNDDLSHSREMFKKLYFCVRLVDQNVPSSSRVKFWCCVMGYPEPRVEWFREGQKLNCFTYNASKRYQTKYDNGIAQLLIENAQNCDSGEYTCVAMNTQDRVTTTAFLTVYTSPTIFAGSSANKALTSSYAVDGYKSKYVDKLYVWNSDDLRQKPKYDWRSFDESPRYPKFISSVIADDIATYGGTIALQVRVQGTPLPNITWLRESKPLPRTSNKYVYLDEGGLYTLLVNESTSGDSGTYVCRACNLYGSVDAEKSIKVVSPQDYSGHRNVKPAIIVSRPKDRMSVAVGEDITVTLRVAGEPKPKVIWMRGARDVTFLDRSSKETVNDYVKLSIKRAQLSDAGTYFIVAKNIYGSDRAFVTVGVSDRLRISPNS